MNIPLMYVHAHRRESVDIYLNSLVKNCFKCLYTEISMNSMWIVQLKLETIYLPGSHPPLSKFRDLSLEYFKPDKQSTSIKKKSGTFRQPFYLFKLLYSEGTRKKQ